MLESDLPTSRGLPARFLHPLVLALMALVLVSSPACASKGEGTGETTSPAADAGAGPEVAVHDTAGGAGEVDGEGCDCPDDEHCLADGLCEEDICVKGRSTCETTTSIKVCSEGGASFEVIDCPAGQICSVGTCVEQICTPGEAQGCEDGQVLLCDSLGSAWYAAPCPSGQWCWDGQCRTILPNLLLLVDTSSSMNWTPTGIQPDDCVGAQCPPWSYPGCDDPNDPKTRLGKVKKAMTAILDSESAADVRIALQRFPQDVYTVFPPDCDGGYWSGNSKLSNDEDFHSLSKTWLQQRLGEIILQPFPAAGETDLGQLERWFDFTESLAETSATCSENEDCDYTPCLNSHCMAYTNPEVWGMGLTPLGKSLFYAGEYLRHFVLVEGKPCETDADCGSASYSCQEGTCRDPAYNCRPTVIIAFTDGEETEYFYTEHFFHPRVQAKRLHYGLACESDADCGAGATCVDTICRPPAGAVDEDELVCDSNDVPCVDDDDCPAFRCRPAKIDNIDPAGADHLTDLEGGFISLTIHVVDASNVPGANQLIAAYGGGQHFSVDLEDPEVLYDTFQILLGDAKNAAICE